MPKALFNIAYTLPSPPTNLRGNARSEYTARRKFYDMSAEYNIFSYMLDGKKCAKNKTAEDYFERTGTGLFGKNGEYTSEEKEVLRERLRKSKSIIWHGFVSFDDQTSLGFTSTTQAQKFMAQTFGAFLNEARFKKDNIEWFASLHTDKHHHHIHFAFFEKEPKHRDKNGVLGFRRIGKIQPRAIENYLVSANMHLSEHAAEYYTARDAAMDRLKEVRGDMIQAMRRGDRREMRLQHAICDLKEKLPKTGRLQYNSENVAHLRPDIDRVAQMLVASDPTARVLHERMLKQLARVQVETYHIAVENKLTYVNGRRMDEQAIDGAMDGTGKTRQISVNMKNVDYFDRLRADYNARLGNMVLGLCKKWQYGCRSDGKRYVRVNDKTCKIAAGRSAKNNADVIRHVIKALCAFDGQQDNFMHSVHEHESDIRREQWQRV